MSESKWRRLLNKWKAWKENKRRKIKLGWVLRKIEWRKKEGYTSLELEDYFTPADKKWLRENTACKISEDSDEHGYYLVFKW